MKISEKAGFSIPWLALVWTGCVAETTPYRTPAHWQKTGYHWPGEPATSSNDDPVLSGAPSDSRVSEEPSTFVPVGPRAPAPDLAATECLDALRREGLHFSHLEELRGVEIPVEVQEQIGGVRYFADDGRALQMDCRLAVSLAQLGPALVELGVSAIRYSGAYSYRTTRSGRLSHHAHGLAIDLHDFELRGRKLTVKADFEKGAGCGSRAPVLNRVACTMQTTVTFQEFLTPDDNSDHRDHLHVAVARRDQLED